MPTRLHAPPLQLVMGADYSSISNIPEMLQNMLSHTWVTDKAPTLSSRKTSTTRNTAVQVMAELPLREPVPALPQARHGHRCRHSDGARLQPQEQRKVVPAHSTGL